jgi:outer membrane protein
MRPSRKHVTILGCLMALWAAPVALAQPRVSGGERSPDRPAARPAKARSATRPATRPVTKPATTPKGARARVIKPVLTIRPAAAEKSYGPGAITLSQAVDMAKKQNLDLKVSKISIRSAKVSKKLGWAMLGPHFSLGLDFAFLGGDSSFDAMGSGGGLDFSDPNVAIAYGQRVCSPAQDPDACLLWMGSNGEYTGLVVGEAMSAFGSIGDIFNADTVKLQLGFSWQLLDWNNLINVKRFKLAHRMAKVSHKNTSADVVTNVKVIFYGILAAQEAVKIVQETSGATKEHLRQAKALMAAGLGTKVDVLRWQAKIADDEQKLLEAQQQVASAKMRLNNLMGRPLRSAVVIVPPAEVTAEIPPQPKGVAEPLRSHPQLRLTRLNVKMTKIGEQTAKAAFLPTVTLSGGYTFQNFMPYEDFSSSKWLGSWAVMLSVKVPIFDSMTKVYNVQLKQLEVSKARMQSRNVRRLLTEAVLQADLSVNKSYKSIGVARKQVKLAAEAHKSADNLYRAGNAKTTDVLDAQNGLRLAKFNLLNARFGYLSALVRRDKAIGAVQ